MITSDPCPHSTADRVAPQLNDHSSRPAGPWGWTLEARDILLTVRLRS